MSLFDSRGRRAAVIVGAGRLMTPFGGFPVCGARR
jgi:hypothetical protein